MTWLDACTLYRTLWPGTVPADRVAALAAALQDVPADEVGKVLHALAERSTFRPAVSEVVAAVRERLREPPPPHDPDPRHVPGAISWTSYRALVDSGAHPCLDPAGYQMLCGRVLP